MYNWHSWLGMIAGNEGTIIHFFPQLLIQSATRHPSSIPRLLIRSATRHPIERWDNGLLDSTRKVSRDFLEEFDMQSSMGSSH